jgi:hypothetical protein
MSAGILRSKYMSRLNNAKYPFEYFSVFNEYVMYELDIFMYNVKEIIKHKN